MKGLWAMVAYDKKEADAGETLEILEGVVAEASRPNDKEAFDQSCWKIAKILYEEQLLESRASALDGCPDDSIERYFESLERAKIYGKEGAYLPIVRVAPVYPKAAIDQELSGQVIVEFTVTRKGRVKSPEVVESTNEVFDRAALKAVELFRYKPRKEGRKAVDVPGVRTAITFDYNELMRRQMCR